MNKEYSKSDFQKLLSSYSEARELNPKKVEKDAYYSLLDMGAIELEGINKIKSKMFIICAIICALMIVLLFITSGPEAMMGLGGYVFFIAGYAVGREKDGLVALYAHGLIGYSLMNGFAVYTIFSTAMKFIHLRVFLLLLAIAIIIQLIGLIYAAIYNFSDNLKIYIFNKNIPMLLATISTIIINVTAAIIVAL